MHKILKEYKAEIERYCETNSLSAAKTLSSPWAGNGTEVILQYVDLNSERAKLGLLDDAPAPTTLEIYLEHGKLRFVQTDITHKYLGVDRETEKPAVTTRPTASRTPTRELAYA